MVEFLHTTLGVAVVFAVGILVGEVVKPVSRLLNLAGKI